MIIRRKPNNVSKTSKKKSHYTFDPDFNIMNAKKKHAIKIPFHCY